MAPARVFPGRETSVLSDGFDALAVCHRKTLVALGRPEGLVARLTKTGRNCRLISTRWSLGSPGTTSTCCAKALRSSLFSRTITSLSKSRSSIRRHAS